MKKVITFLGILLSLTSCGQKHKDHNHDNNIYSNQELGWTIEIPKNWDVITQTQIKKLEEIGKETSDYEIDTSGLKYLIGFKKNILNFFQSSSEHLDHPEKWEFYQKGLKEMVFNNYVSNGVKVDSTATKIIEVDGLKFQHYKFRVYNSKGELVINQLVYSRLINNESFGVNINYNNEADKEEMLKAWFGSKFRK